MKLITMIICTSLLFSMGACTKSADETTASAKENLQELRATMSSKLDAIDNEISSLESKVEKNSNEVSAKFQKRLSSVKEMRKEIAEDLESVSEKTKDSVSNLRIKVRQKYEVMSRNLEKALKELS